MTTTGRTDANRDATDGTPGAPPDAADRLGAGAARDAADRVGATHARGA